MAETTAANCDAVEGGYRLSNDLFEAVVSFAGATPGITHLAHRGDVAREVVEVKEVPITLRLATDAPRIDIPNWMGHAGSGNALTPEEDWGYQLKLHKNPAGGITVQRLTDFPVGPPWYTDTFYPGFYWYRQMFNLPKEWNGRPIVFVLGGCDEYDWRAYWIYLNGERIGQSSFDDTYLGVWHEVPRYVLTPGDPGYAQLKFGEPNLLAVQARRIDRRTPAMNQFDVERYSGQSMLVDQYVAGGEPTRDVTGFTAVDHRTSVVDGVAAVEMDMVDATKQIAITVRYWLRPGEAALHKEIVVHNESNAAMTLLEADILNLSFGKTQIAGGGQGWPCRIGEDWFAGVTHPSGVARHGKEGLRLQVIPGAVLDPVQRQAYVSKTAVIGVGNGRRAFSDYLQSHGRRKPTFLDMYSLYGLCEIASGLYPPIELTEALLLKSMDRMRDFQNRGIRFGYYCIDTGWNDPVGDLKKFHPANFPNGSDKAFKAIHDLGMKPLLWMSPSAGPAVFRGGVQNPFVPPNSESNNCMWGAFCLSGDRWRTILREAMLHHVRNNGVHGFKLDEVTFYCGRTTHGHLPNKYGIEANMDALIDTLDQVKKECPDLLVMFYWRFMSPWWLIHADTIYERGLLMEAATPSEHPSPVIRQSVTVALDQGHDYNWDRMPLIGQDSLGVWLSNTRWGSWMGADGWRDAWVMDFVRGNMMHQLWGDLSLLNDEDVEFMATIARWTKENSQLLKHPKRIGGTPWRPGPYGYACCAGDRGVVVLHNADLAGNKVDVSLSDAIGLSAGVKAYEVTWIYKAGSVNVKQKQVVPAGGVLQVKMGSYEVCMADIAPAGATTVEAGGSIPCRPAARRLAARFEQTKYRKLDWYSPDDQKSLARVMNGRTTPTNSPDVFAVGPDRSDERDRDIVEETRVDSVAVPALDKPSKLLVIARFAREGIAWHHLGPHTILHVEGVVDGKALTVRTTPHRYHEEAGGWSWIVHEFDLPAGCGTVHLTLNADHPKTVAIETDMWLADA